MRKKKKQTSLWKYIALTLLVAILLVVAIGVFAINYLLNRLQYEQETLQLRPPVEVTEDEFGFILAPEPDVSTEDLPVAEQEEGGPVFVQVTPSPQPDGDGGEMPAPTAEPTPVPQTLPPEEIEAILGEVKENYESSATATPANTTNIMLIGVDSRSGSIYGRSDTMMLATINHDKNKVVLTSFLRDTLVYVPGYGYTKLGHANAFGGPSLLLQTIQNNFKVSVDNYALVNFGSMERIVDSLGGLEIPVTAQELRYIPNGVSQFGADYSGTRSLRLNGAQTLAYARIRVIGTDFARTSRQRTVIEAILQELGSESVTGLLRFLDDTLPLVTTNMSKSELISLATRAPGILRYQRSQFRVPIDGTYEDKHHYEPNVLVIDYPRNLKALHAALD